MDNSPPRSWLWPASRLGEAPALTTGFEAQPAETPYSDFERQLPHMGPALVHFPTSDGSAFLALLPGSMLLTPDLKKVRASPAAIRSALCSNMEAPVLLEIQETLN